jgi:hypothetical protein
MANRSRLRLLTAVLAVAAVVVAVLLLRSRPTAGPVAQKPTEDYQPGAPGALPPLFSPTGEAIAKPMDANADVLKKSLADYKAVTVYPPWSRPLDEQTRPKLTWNQPVIDDLPMNSDPGKETTFHFGADRYQVPYGEALTSWIEVVRKSDGKRVPFTTTDGYVYSVDQGQIAPVSYHDDGLDGDEVAGDLRFSNRMVPSSFAKLKSKAQQAFIKVIVAQDGASQPIMRDFQYAPRKAIELTGVARDDVVGGNLELAVGAKVTEKGLYTFEANLMSGDGSTPIVYAEFSKTLDSGAVTVPLTFFGRAFREKGLDGPYLVRDLRVFRRFVTEDEQNFYDVFGSTYATRAYRKDQFSNAEWDAPEKQETIGHFNDLISQAENGTTQPVPSSPPPTIQPTEEPQLPSNPAVKARPPR